MATLSAEGRRSRCMREPEPPLRDESLASEEGRLR